MNFAENKTIREIAVESPATIRVFEQFGIDYCCGGRKPLAQACEELQLSLDQVKEKLAEALGTPQEADLAALTTAPLRRVIQHIVREHHTYCRQELPRLTALAAKVVSRHGETHPELAQIQQRVHVLRDEMFSHMQKEEEMLFPYIAKMEFELEAGREMPGSVFGSVANPIRRMMMEHDSAGELTAEIRALSGGYQPPEGACPSYRGFFSGLQEFEADLHRHVHLENNILFPRAQRMEEEAGGGGTVKHATGMQCGFERGDLKA